MNWKEGVKRIWIVLTAIYFVLAVVFNYSSFGTLAIEEYGGFYMAWAVHVLWALAGWTVFSLIVFCLLKGFIWIYDGFKKDEY